MAVEEGFEFLYFGQEVTLRQPFPVSLRWHRVSIGARDLRLGAARARAQLVAFDFAPGTGQTGVRVGGRHHDSW